MSGCCGGATCACVISQGTGISVSGVGSAQSPFVIAVDRGIAVVDTSVFNLTLSGAGTATSPWTLQVDFAATAKLTNIPDVNAAAPTNGQVLSWNSATSKWVPAAPTTAASGSVQHGNGLTGDGSVGTPLSLVLDPARMLSVSVSGFGLSDVGLLSLVRRFVDSIARAASATTPVLNSLTMLDSAPGQVNYWDGAQWSPLVGATDRVIGTPEFLSLSGSYVAQRRTDFTKPMSVVTDAGGNFDVLTPADLSGRGGVLDCFFQETGILPFKVSLYANVDRISGIAYNLVNGTPYASQAISGLVRATLY